MQIPLKVIAVLFLTLGHSAAHAFIPPAFYLYERIAPKKNEPVAPQSAVLHFKVLQRTSIGMDVPLGDFQISASNPYQQGWPSISLLLSQKADDLKSIVQRFGIPVKKESELVRLSPEAAAATKTPIRPYYNRDDNVKMRRLRNTIAYVHADAMNPQKSIWVDKDSFFPLKIEAPCPMELEKIPGIKPGPGICALEFHNLSGAKQGRLSGSKFLFLKDNALVFTLSLERIQTFKQGKYVEANSASALGDDVLPLVKLLLN